MSRQYMTQVVTGKVRLSYAHVFRPREDQNGRLRYSVTILIPKTDTDTVNKINDAIQAASQKGLDGNWGGAMPPQLPIPLHDGDGVRESGEPFGEECKGHWVMTASADENHPPEVVDGNLNKILDQNAIYSGCYAHVFINFYPYGGTNGIKKGVGAGLGPIQKVADGERLGGGAPSASSVFGKVAGSASSFGTPVTGVANPFPPQQQQAVQQPQPQQQGYTAMAPNINPLTGQTM